jgi:hypothetical protein
VSRFVTLVLAAAVLGLLCSAPAPAQQTPTKNLTVIKVDGDKITFDANGKKHEIAVRPGHTKGVDAKGQEANLAEVLRAGNVVDISIVHISSSKMPPTPFLSTVTLVRAAAPAKEKTAPATVGTTPVPDEAALAAADKLVKEVFKADYAKKRPAEQVEFARKLLKSADETADEPAARFVMYRDARELAARAGEVSLAMEAIDAATRVFAVRPAELKAAALELAEKSPAATPNALAEAALAAVADAVRADDYPTAGRLLKLAAAAAPRAKPPLTATVAARSKEVDAQRREFEAVESDLKAAAAGSADPAAASRAGRFLCLIKGNWDAGLLLLAKGGDAKLKAAADKDLAQPTTAAARVEAGDAWWDIGEGLDPAAQTGARLRADHWYRQAAPELTGLTKARIDKRIAEVAKVAEQRTSKTAPAGWVVIFRSADPAFWNTDTNRGRDHFALPVDKAPANVKYLRLTDTVRKDYVIVEMTNDRLGTRTEQSGYGWNGENSLQWRGHHLGVYDPTMTRKVSVSVYQAPGPLTDHSGWGFGHRVMGNDTQGYTWAGAPTPTTVYEIAVKTTALTAEETRRLLIRKK